MDNERMLIEKLKQRDEAAFVSETNQRMLLHRARSKVRGILENHFSTATRTDRDGAGIDLQATDGADNRLPGRTVTAK
jgi:hypothetical protein